MTRTTKQTHTPGPWRATAGLNRWNVTTDTKPRGFNVCAVNTERMEQEANAHLIAAAPELLEALKRAATFIGEALIDNELSDDLIPLHNDMLAAIAKAEGR